VYSVPVVKNPPTATVPVDLSHLEFDSTNQIDYQKKEARIRNGEAFLTAALLAEMEATWGGSFAAVKTITDKVNQKVYVFPSEPKDDADDIVPLRKSGTLSNATFAFSLPLKKLELKLRKDRQIVLFPLAVPVLGMKEAYCLNFKGVRATKRPRIALDEGDTPETNANGAETHATTADSKAPAEATAASTAAPKKTTRAKSKAPKGTTSTAS
jgi:hypothetical protein